MNFGEFEKEYLSIRGKEGRIYDDATVKKLPFIDHPEWRVRARSVQRLLRQLKKEQCVSFVEVGCGNGWLTNYLSENLAINGVGVDINKQELDQAIRVFQGRSTFIYGDIISLNLAASTTIFAASIQYFPDFEKIIDSLTGTIHIIDTPFYSDGAAARKRSEAYFDGMNSNMKDFYFHHEYNDLKKYDVEFLYRPNRIKTFFGDSPFPWIRIRKGPSASSQSK